MITKKDIHDMILQHDTNLQALSDLFDSHPSIHTAELIQRAVRMSVVLKFAYKAHVALNRQSVCDKCDYCVTVAKDTLNILENK